MSNLKNIEPLQDFNWEEFENGSAVGTSREELQKAYDETLNKVADHQVVDGKVTAVDKKEVVVNIGYKSDGIIPASEFRYNPNATSSFISDFDIRYLLLPNGNLSIKVYNQTNDRYFTRNSLNTQGIGLLMKKDFSYLADLFNIKKKPAEDSVSVGE